MNPELNVTPYDREPFVPNIPDAAGVSPEDTETYTRLRLDQMQFLADQTFALLAHIDTHSRYLFANKSYAERFGLTPEMIVGKRVPEVVGEAAYTVLHPYLERAFAGENINCEIEVPVSPFDTGLMRVRCVPEQTEDGTVRGVATIFMDITERRRSEETLRESEARFRQLADSMPQMVWTARPDGYIDYYNERWYEYTGFPRDTFGDKSWKSILHPDDVTPCDETYYQSIRTGKAYQIEYRFKDRWTGGYRWFLGRALPIRDENGHIVKWYGTCTDIDDQKRAQAEIQNLNMRWRRAMTETHHRVRNNLQILVSMIDPNTLNPDALLPAAEFARLSQHVHSLAAIHDILTSQAKAGGEANTLSVQEMMARLLLLLQELAVSRRIHFRVDDVMLPSRPVTTLAIVTNELVSNALKYGHGLVEVTFTIEGDRAMLRVCDQGPGFPGNFDPERDGGTGLELVTSLAGWDLQGSVFYENPPEGGARVSIIFTLSPLARCSLVE